MTKAQRKLYHYKWDRFQKRQERIYATKFKKALHDQIIQYAYSGKITAEPIHKVLVELYVTVGRLWAHQVQVLTKRAVQVKARQPMGFNERIVELMREFYSIDLLNDAETITDYTREIIQKVLSESAMSGASINDIVRTLSASTELSTMRARRISRTETVNAANTAGLLQAKETGVPMRKEWMAVSDRRTRHSHKNIDGVSVELDAYFNVGGATMQNPGARKQENGQPVPPSQTVNCRCTLAYVVIE